MSKSLLDAPRVQRRSVALIACSAAVLAHGIAAGAAATMKPGADADERPHTVLLSEMIEIEEAPPPAPPPPPAVEEEPPPLPPKVFEKAHVLAPRVAAPEEPPPAAAPAAAQAAHVLAQEPKDEVLDFGEAIVQGESPAYAGGVTETGGTSTRAVRKANARTGGIEGGSGTDVSGIDRSRPATLAGGAVWDCPFPEEADDEGIDTAVVTLSVRVALDGTLEAADVARDPGSGFGREARRCARDKRWQPAHDRAGNPIASASVINVRFSR